MALTNPLTKLDKEADFDSKKEMARPEERRRVVLGVEKTEKTEVLPEMPRQEIPLSEEEKITPAALPPVPSSPIPHPVKKDPHLVEIEKILEADLADTFLNLAPETQQKFKAEGERAAGIIWQMVETAKIQIKRIANLIRHWLKIIPGINRFFLEQETKIKTDQIIALARKHKK